MTARERLKSKLTELGHTPNKSFGQNFLVSDSAIEKILKSVEKFSANHLYEIGPGLGAITDLLLQLSGQKTLIEFDKNLVGYWEPRLSGADKIIQVDALKYDWKTVSDDNCLLVSNLPYQISAPLVIELTVQAIPFRAMILMFQKEVAQRITASHSTEAFGIISVIAQNFWKTKKLVDLGPGAFFPPPKVDSQVLEFTPLEDPPEIDRKKFLNFVKSAFSQRRKKMIKNLGLKKEQKSHFERALEELGYPETIRAEAIKAPDFVTLFNSLQKIRKMG